MNYIVEHFRSEWAVFLLSMIPISELRGSIPLGISLGLPPFEVFLISIAGNMLPVPFLLKLFRPIIRYVARTRLLRRPAAYVLKKVNKGSNKVIRYELLGLFLLVAIPLPTTGAWTGSAVAAFLKLDFKKSFLFIFMGVITAGVIMLAISTAGASFWRMT
jgi:uncharacterized membrane protein